MYFYDWVAYSLLTHRRKPSFLLLLMKPDMNEKREKDFGLITGSFFMHAIASTYGFSLHCRNIFVSKQVIIILTLNIGVSFSISTLVAASRDKKKRQKRNEIISQPFFPLVSQPNGNAETCMVFLPSASCAFTLYTEILNLGNPPLTGKEESDLLNIRIFATQKGKRGVFAF